jgi:UDP-N-acetylglucosamine diphosphorylase/glucosamine-1-phosphate N-acetyltransferase
MNFILFDDERAANFLPLSYTRPVSEMRCGIWTMREKWERYCSVPISYHCAQHLQAHFPKQTADRNILINSACFPTAHLFGKIIELKLGEILSHGQTLIAAHLTEEAATNFSIPEIIVNSTEVIYDGELDFLENTWDIFSKNDAQIRIDFEHITKGKTSQKISNTNTLIGNDIFIEEGAKVEAAILNSSTGPIYIGRHAEIMEGSAVRGPLALGDNAVLKLSTKIYGATTIGPGCKVGGEVNNSVFFQNSSKAHDGFVGNAVIGEWCNLGADTNNSNLKNNYEEVKIWSEAKSTFVKTGLQFCGLIMGDHSKCGINTMFNTGTVVGVSANIYGGGFPRNFIPSFSWGGSAGMLEYKLEKAILTASKVFARREKEFTQADAQLFQHIFEQTQHQRAN